MPILPSEHHAVGIVARDRCYRCFRPTNDCFCASIPLIQNETDVLILQHKREHGHPFNTARFVHKALRNSRLLVDYPAQLAAKLCLRPRAGLLYPGPDAALISELSRDERPEQLVILDGTWHHAKTLLRDIAALHDLPRYRIAPHAPSRYRIRREPSAMFLSTVEAAVAALRALEPETAGLDQLLATFERMVERQLAHPKTPLGWRRHKQRNRTPLNIPTALLGNLDNIVVAYGEATPGVRGCKRETRRPLYLVAERLGTGECFECAVQPAAPLSAALLRHLELDETDFSGALPLTAARSAWSAYQRAGDVLVVFSPSTASLFAAVSDALAPCLVLKSVDFHPQRRYGTLDEIIATQRLVVPPVRHAGRAGQRLANAVAMVRFLNAVGNVPRQLIGAVLLS